MSNFLAHSASGKTCTSSFNELNLLKINPLIYKVKKIYSILQFTNATLEFNFRL